tara:strand:+ start:729 stop:1187 length:459 start_codon:yes stop_codon:yes gene_type:complete
MDKKKKDEMHKVDDILHKIELKLRGDLPDDLVDSFINGLYIGADSTYDEVFNADESDMVKDYVWLNNVETLQSMFRIDEDSEHRKDVLHSMNITLAHLKAFLAMIGLSGVAHRDGKRGQELMDDILKAIEFLSNMYVKTVKQFEEMFGDGEE